MIQILGICFIVGIIYGVAKRFGFTTLVKGLVGFVVLGFFVYCGIKALPTVWSFIAPWMGIIIILLIIWGVLKITGLVR